MKVALVTGAAGLVGSEAAFFFAGRFDRIIGIDNDMRRYFFGDDASVLWNRRRLEQELGNYEHHDTDVRDHAALARIFEQYGSDISLIVHAAAQPSHDWAAKEPLTDFSINATATVQLLELTRRHSPEAVFVYTSTNKVYGDNPNKLPLVEQETRWEVDRNHHYFERGIDESMSLDDTSHSIFGASKVAADIMAQEYGKYFGLKVGVFRGGCLTGPNHSGARLHGFLSYLMKCAVTGEHYSILGYKGKQVRDNIHARDLIEMFWHFYESPRRGESYNAGGGRFSNCSVLEAIRLAEKITGRKMNYSYVDTNRLGDHIWWISDVTKFKAHYPGWTWRFGLEDTMVGIFERQVRGSARFPEASTR